MTNYKGYCCNNCGETDNYTIESMYTKYFSTDYYLSTNYDERGYCYLINVNEGLIDKIYCYSCNIVSELINIEDERRML